MQTNGNNSDLQRAAIRPTSAPPVDVYENDDEILVVADMPGARSDSVTVKLEKDELYISAVRDGDTDGQLLAGGRRDCEYRRTFLIPRGVDAERHLGGDEPGGAEGSPAQDRRREAASHPGQDRQLAGTNRTRDPGERGGSLRVPRTMPHFTRRLW